MCFSSAIAAANPGHLPREEHPAGRAGCQQEPSRKKVRRLVPSAMIVVPFKVADFYSMCATQCARLGRRADRIGTSSFPPPQRGAVQAFHVGVSKGEEAAVDGLLGGHRRRTEADRLLKLVFAANTQ